MTIDILVRYAHFLGIIGVAGSLVSLHLLVSDEMTPLQVRRARVVNSIYGLTSLIVLGAGVALWVAVGKPKDFYSKNGLFHAKFGLFVVMGLLSIAQSRFLRRSSGSEGNVELPKSVKMTLRIQLLLLLVIPFLATLVAAGVGLKAE